MGFRDVEGFNMALLGKQLWRLATHPDVLASRVLKGKYFPKSDPLHAKLGTRPSFAWRSIWGAQHLMREGMKKNFGNGDRVNLLKDPWIGNSRPHPPRLNCDMDPRGPFLCALKDPASDEWNRPRLLDWFSNEDVKLICQIRSGVMSPTTDFSWIHNHNGEYSVKSGYWIWLSRISNFWVPGEVLQPSLEGLFEQIWKTHTTPKIRNFLWRALKNCLAVGMNLKYKKLTFDPQCFFCGHERETVNHVLFTCPFARLVWASSPAASLFYPAPSESIMTNLASCLFLFDENRDWNKERLRCWPWILWKLWKSRNEMHFMGQREDVHRLIQSADQEAIMWHEANAKDQSIPVRVSSHSTLPWKPPPRGSFKCNIDGSWKSECDVSGIGWILRDEQGVVRWYGMKTYPKLASPLEVEGAALLWAMACVDNLGFHNVVFETDSKELLQVIDNPLDWPRMAAFVEDVKMLRRYLAPSWCFGNRSSNACADSIAKASLSGSLYSASLDCIVPPWLRPLVLSDMRCMNL